MNRLQKIAFAAPFTDNRKMYTPPVEWLPGGLAVGLSLNH